MLREVLPVQRDLGIVKKYRNVSSHKASPFKVFSTCANNKALECKMSIC